MCVRFVVLVCESSSVVRVWYFGVFCQDWGWIGLRWEGGDCPRPAADLPRLVKATVVQAKLPVEGGWWDLEWRKFPTRTAGIQELEREAGPQGM